MDVLSFIQSDRLARMIIFPLLMMGFLVVLIFPSARKSMLTKTAAGCRFVGLVCSTSGLLFIALYQSIKNRK